ncbi:hypothetical protein M0R19_03580 [Candidatus Pacearchaeota archaeon]|jgi:predicted nuclease with TOPRIM domain|nr:hypothetical protein [Candidatus Pacearchaeota archaeon]
MRRSYEEIRDENELLIEEKIRNREQIFILEKRMEEISNKIWGYKERNHRIENLLDYNCDEINSKLFP